MLLFGDSPLGSFTVACSIGFPKSPWGIRKNWQGRGQDFSKGGSPSGDRRLYMVYTAALPRVSAWEAMITGEYLTYNTRKLAFTKRKNSS